MFYNQHCFCFSDTQEAPKTLGLDSSSSCESLIEESTADITITNNTTNLPALTSTPHQNLALDTNKPLNMGLTLPPLPINRSRMISNGSGAFISYVRRRGEPDGGRTDNESTPASGSGSSGVLYPTLDSSLNNTTDSELSDGYISQSHITKTNACRLGPSTLRGPVRVSRPGGGGESDAAFTPSPPVTNQNPVDPNVSLALAHQTRIRNLYSGTGLGYLGDNVIPEMSAVPTNTNNRRPDSSSSASSTTDWEGSGHATVLRRGGLMPPLPPPRQNMPLVDSLRPMAPMAPVYNNLGQTVGSNLPANNATGTLDSNSSESDFERGLKVGQLSHFRLKPKIKLGSAQTSVAARVNKEHALFMDRLSVRTEVNTLASANNVAAAAAVSSNNTAGSRKPINLPEDDDNALVFNASNLYFSQADNDLLQEAKKDLGSTTNSNMPSSSNVSSQGAVAKEAVKTNQKTIQDSIMRHMNREMTPTISEVYHERNLGLGLAPPLSKLLLSKNYDETENLKATPATSNALKSLVDAVSEMELSGASSTSSVSTANTKTLNTQSSSNNTAAKEVCSICGEPADIICRCKAATVQKKSNLKPWLSNVPSSIVKASDLTTADNLERQHKIRTSVTSTIANMKRAPSPFNEFCRRDEGDGRSVADSQCSSNYKNITALKNDAAAAAAAQQTNNTGNRKV